MIAGRDMPAAKGAVIPLLRSYMTFQDVPAGGGIEATRERIEERIEAAESGSPENSENWKERRSRAAQ